MDYCSQVYLFGVRTVHAETVEVKKSVLTEMKGVLGFIYYERDPHTTDEL